MLKFDDTPRARPRPAAAAAWVALVGACLASSALAGPPEANGLTPDGARQVAHFWASGVQIYTCRQGAETKLGWVFKAPDATLYDVSGKATLKHGEGPSWVAADGSKIVGHALKQTPSDHVASIPQLLLETTSVGRSGSLSAVRYVERLHTVGGLEPHAACVEAGQEGSSPYLAEYLLFE